MKNQWIQFIKHDKSDNWWMDNLYKLDQFLLDYGQRPVASIQTNDINNYIAKLKNRGLAPNTVLNHFKPIRQMLKFAVSSGFIERNPMDSALLPKAKEKRRFGAIPKEIIVDIFSDKSIELKHRKFWKLCYYTGLDLTDAGTLQKHNINNGIITLHRKKSDVPVQIPIHHKLTFNIINLMPDKNKRYGSSKLLKKQLAKREISGSIKNLRASFISHLHDSGLSAQDIKIAVGHTSEKMTAHYTTAQIDSVRRSINTL